MDELKPEEKTEIVLWDWLKTKSVFIKEIYFNRKNKLGWKTFRVEGLQKKPDMLIQFDRGYGMEFAIMETKFASSSKSVLDSGKILDYYENYYLGKTKYFIEDKEIKINHFVITTQNSLNGFLFNTDNQVISNECSSDEWRKTNAKYGLEPKFEFNETSRFQRSLWNEFKRLREKLDIKEGPSVGLIISEISENGSTNNVPYLFIMRYNVMLNRKSKWGARFWKL